MQVHSRQELDTLFLSKYGNPRSAGWSPRMRFAFGYFTPDDIYEATVDKLVTPDSVWLDVGSGRDLFPSNPRLARQLADRSALLVGVDVSPNIEENAFVHERYRCAIEDFHCDRQFTLVTMRMVAEHITNTADVLERLSHLVADGGSVVVYTVNKWAPVSIVSSLVPFQVHHKIKSRLWNTEEKDTFAVAYRMNTRKELRRLFEAARFKEDSFTYIDDCRSLAKWSFGSKLELTAWSVLRSVGLRYPETCLLGIYRKLPT